MAGVQVVTPSSAASFGTFIPTSSASCVHVAPHSYCTPDVQVYHDCIPVMQANATGYVQLGPAGLDAPQGVVPVHDALAGLQRTARSLARASTITKYAVGDEQHQRIQKVAQGWETWACNYPESVKPQLATCQPAEVVCFLDDWRFSHVGKRLRPGADCDAKQEVAASTLRKVCSHLSSIMIGLGRYQPWTPDCPRGNPVKHPSVSSFLKGYDLYSFRVLNHTVAGAVPLTFEKYCMLRDYLLQKVDTEGDPGKQVTLLRDLCAFSYLWETGQRGKECCSLLLSDFKYQDLQCTEAWADILSQTLSSEKNLLVEGSQGTKTRHTRHPGVIKLAKQPESDGAGELPQFLPAYAQAMASSGSPLSHWLFPNRTHEGHESSTTKGATAHVTSSALRQRLVLHLSSLDAWEGETLHSFRRGSSQHQASLGLSPDQLAQSRMWRSPRSVELYLHPQRHLYRLRPLKPT